MSLFLFILSLIQSNLINYFPQNATKGYEKVLGDQLRKETNLVVPDAVSIPSNVIQYNAAYLGV